MTDKIELKRAAIAEHVIDLIAIAGDHDEEEFASWAMIVYATSFFGSCFTKEFAEKIVIDAVHEGLSQAKEIRSTHPDEQ